MGAVINKFNTKKEKTAIMTGLDASGKTTILYKLKLGEPADKIPTIGFSYETLELKSIGLNIPLVFDVGGQHKIRHLWREFFQNADALIFVIDSNDRKRLRNCDETYSETNYNTYVEYTSYNEFHYLLSEDLLKDVIVLIFANKQDLPNAMNINEIAEKMELHKVKQQWFIHSSCACTGDGLYEGIEWLMSKLNNHKHNEYVSNDYQLTSDDFKLKMKNSTKSILSVCGWIRNIARYNKLSISCDIAKMVHAFYQLECEYDKNYIFY
eukprot:528500_1